MENTNGIQGGDEGKRGIERGLLRAKWARSEPSALAALLLLGGGLAALPSPVSGAAALPIASHLSIQPGSALSPPLASVAVGTEEPQVEKIAQSDEGAAGVEVGAELQSELKSGLEAGIKSDSERGASTSSTKSPASANLAAVKHSSGKSSPGSALPFAPGEKLAFHIRYLSMRVGEAMVEVTDDPNRELWPLVAQANTRGLFHKLHPIDQKFRSHFSPSLGRATGSDFQLEEKGKVRTERVRINGDTAQVLIRKSDEVIDDLRPVPPNGHDILSAIFHLRSLPLEVGQTVKIPVFTGHRDWEMNATVLRKEEVHTDHAIIPALLLHCQTHFTGSFESKSALKIWLSDDELRVPVQLEADFALGAMKATLAAYTPPKKAPQPGKEAPAPSQTAVRVP